MKTSTAAVVTCAMVVIGVVLLPAIGGPLNPPAGPPASTPGPEPQIAVNATNTPGDPTSVFRIDLPGSYYLAGNVIGVAARNGITITASNVTLDLMGFEVRGADGQASLDGIRVGGVGGVNIAVLNGSVSGWGGDGIDAFTGAGNVRIEGVSVSANGGDGIRVGINCMVSRCAVFGNVGDGIEAGEASIIGACTSRSNGLGIRAGDVRSITDCIVSHSVNNGIQASSGCRISGNVSAYSGIGTITSSDFSITGDYNRIEGNQSINGFRGISAVGARNVIVRNTCSNVDTFANRYFLFENNYYGPIIPRVGFPTPQASGDSAPSTLSTTDPYANFSVK